MDGYARLYTSEPMVTRALAAEIRHAPDAFLALIRVELGLPLTGVPAVRCEGRQRVDVELRFGGAEELTVGIEAKLDHELTPDQLDRQLGAVDAVVVIVPDEVGPLDWVEERRNAAVLTWSQVLECFREPRLTLADIRGFPLSKVQGESPLRALDVAKLLPADWKVVVRRGQAGMPAVEITSPLTPDGRELRAQLQVVGRKMPGPGEEMRYEYAIGVGVDDDDAEFPGPDDEPPVWIHALQRLAEVLSGDEDRLLVEWRPASGIRTRGAEKLALADAHLAGRRWLVKGYVPWSLGIKSRKVGIGRLEELTSVAVDILLRWFDAESRVPR